MDILFLIIIGILSRLIPHLPNMTAVGATGLFASAKLGVRKAFIVVSVTMIITDVLLGFHSAMWATYGCFLFTIFLGQLLKKKPGILTIVGVTFVSSLVFYIVTNFAVWAVPGSMYQHTVQGLVACYINALPFFRNSLIGDMGFSFLFFVAYEFIFALKRRSALKPRGATGPVPNVFRRTFQLSREGMLVSLAPSDETYVSTHSFHPYYVYRQIRAVILMGIKEMYVRS